MTSRTYHVCPDGRNYRIQVRTKYAKASKRSLFEWRGYPCANSANNDVTRLMKFFSDGHKKITDFVSCYTDVSNCRNQGVKLDYSKVIEKVRGCAKRRKRNNLLKEYNSYKKIMISWKEVYLSLEEWINQHNQMSFDKDRFMRRYYRDPKVLQGAITKGLLSPNDSEVTESFKASINYFTDRMKTLEELTVQNKSCLKILRSAIFSGTTFTLLLKAKFDCEDKNDEIINLVEDEPFTLRNISKAQLTRSIQQCQLVEKVYQQISYKLSDEFSLIIKVLKDITDPKYSIATSKQTIQHHWNKIKEHKIIYSVGQIVSNVSIETDGIVSTKVILKWYHEFRYIVTPDLDAHAVLNSCTDFKFERTALQEVVESRGHILLPSVVCTPETAGGGIEYGWGKLKYEQRKENDYAAKLEAGAKFTERVKKLCKNKVILPIVRVFKYQRRARDYIRLYMSEKMRDGKSAPSFTAIERMRKKQKTRRNIMEIDRSFVLEN